MTAEERRAALVERISRAFVSNDSKIKGQEDLLWKLYRRDAETALDIALEEAAQVAERHRGTWEEEEAAAKIIAAAIRDLMEKPDDR